MFGPSFSYLYATRIKRRRVELLIENKEQVLSGTGSFRFIEMRLLVLKKRVFKLFNSLRGSSQQRIEYKERIKRYGSEKSTARFI